MTVRKIAWSAVATGAAGICLFALAANARPSSAAGTPELKPALNGKALYRTYCGKCHALAAALSAGFGSYIGGFGLDGGPSFNELRVPVSYTITAITEPTGGHERLRTRLTSAQVNAVATWLARTTRQHPLPALPTDG